MRKIIGKVLTAPIKIAAMPLRVIKDVAESEQDGLIQTVTDLIERQVEEIVKGGE